MKHFIFAIPVFIFSITAVSANAQVSGKWEIMNEGIGVESMDFVSENVGWIIGSTLLKTQDGGETWISIPMEGDWDFDVIDFVNDSIGWAVADDKANKTSVILKTSNSGQTWLPKYSTMNDSGNQVSLYAINPNIVYLTINPGEEDIESKIIQTLDGGLNWNDISPPDAKLKYGPVYFVTSEIVIVICSDYENSPNGILRTFNGAETWQNIIEIDFQTINNLQFINDSTGYFGANKEGTDKISLFMTTDTLRSWFKISEIPESENFIGVYAFSTNSIVAIKQDSNFINVMKSIDGGYTWEINQSIITQPRGAGNRGQIFTNNDGMGFLIVQNNYEESIYKSIDMGDNWTRMAFSFPFQDVYFISRTIGFACSGDNVGFGHWFVNWGDLLITNDGGITWKNNITGGIFKSILFLNEFLGFMIDPDGIIYITNNSGNDWGIAFECNSDSTCYWFGGYDISFLNREIGWAAGSYRSETFDTSGAALLGTRDGGKNWDLIWKYVHIDADGYRLRSIHAAKGTAWTVGDGGLIVKYTKQDQWQAIDGITDLPLNDVFFIDDDHGWIAGGYLNDQSIQSILLKTTNGGQTWSDIRFDKYLIRDTYFTDYLHGWAVGNDTSNSGMILETVDGGDNWIPQVENLSAELNAIHFKDGNGWAVGENGLFLKTDGTSWVDQSTGKTYPNIFSLSQNYPNPFNPKTIIHYELPATNYVELSIYNILGQKVTTLVSEKQAAGSYQVGWDATDFGSGVYFYQLKTGAFVQSRKMILLQ